MKPMFFPLCALKIKVLLVDMGCDRERWPSISLVCLLSSSFFLNTENGFLLSYPKMINSLYPVKKLSPKHKDSKRYFLK